MEYPIKVPSFRKTNRVTSPESKLKKLNEKIKAIKNKIMKEKEDVDKYIGVALLFTDTDNMSNKNKKRYHLKQLSIVKKRHKAVISLYKSFKKYVEKAKKLKASLSNEIADKLTSTKNSPSK